MASDISTIQSLKAVDAWIDVINANINGGVRTAYKSSRLKFGGSNTDVSRAGSSTSLPLQFPEPGLTTENTVIDFSQGAITASTENTHLAVQGKGFFVLASPDLIDTNPASASFGATLSSPAGKFYFARDGEFRTDSQGFLRHASGLYLVGTTFTGAPGRPVITYNTGAAVGVASYVRAVYNDMDNSTAGAPQRSIRLTDFVAANGAAVSTYIQRDLGGAAIFAMPLLDLSGGYQSLKYSRYGSTVYDIGYQATVGYSTTMHDANLTLDVTSATVLTKSLEASNASMTQSVPELSLAQKLFSALTKVLQTKQTNVDGVLNLVR